MQNSRENTCARAFLFFFSESIFKKKTGSRSDVCCKKGVLKNFTKFTGKQLRQSHFLNKVCRPEAYNFIKMRFWHSCFPVSFAKFFRTPFFSRTSPVAASKQETPADMVYCEFSKKFNKTFFIDQIRVTASLVSRII